MMNETHWNKIWEAIRFSKPQNVALQSVAMEHEYDCSFYLIGLLHEYWGLLFQLEFILHKFRSAVCIVQEIIFMQ